MLQLLILKREYHEKNGKKGNRKNTKSKFLL